MDSITVIGSKRSHRSRKQLHCDLCDRIFLKVDHLVRHRRSHTQEKPFRCDLCDRSYGRQHKRREHSQNNPSHNKGSNNDNCSEDCPPETDTALLRDQETSNLISRGNHDLQYESLNCENSCNDSVLEGSFVDEITHASQFDFAEQPCPGSPRDDTNLCFEDLLQSYDGLRSYFNFDSIFLEGDEQQSGSSPRTANPPEIDDFYRSTLHRRLTVESSPRKLPSTKFLNLCISLYFSRSEDMLPIIHRPTFQLSSANTALVLSVCSMGSLWGPLKLVQDFGADLFERLLKASLFIWEDALDRSPEEALAQVQASVICQSFGNLSGSSRHLMQNDAFHGTIISWARRLKIFDARHKPMQLATLVGQELDQAWREWKQVEERIRIGLTLYIQDSKLAVIFRHEPVLRQNSNFTVCAPDELFMAPTAESWKDKCLRASCAASKKFQLGDGLSELSMSKLDASRVNSILPDCYLTLYGLLGGLSATLLETRIMNKFGHDAELKISKQLCDFYQCFLNVKAPCYRLADLQVLWHLTFMEICTDFTLLDSPLLKNSVSPTCISKLAVSWNSAATMVRCIFHGKGILKVLAAQPFVHHLGLYTLRALFTTGVTGFSASKSLYKINDRVIAEVVDLPELALLKANTDTIASQLGVKNGGNGTISGVDGLLFEAFEQLKAHSSGQAARKYLDDLSVLVHHDLSL